LNVHVVNYVRQTEIHTAEPLVPEPSAFDVEMVIEELKRHTSPDSNKIPPEKLKAGGWTARTEIHKLINSIWNKEELPEEWKESILIPIYKGCHETDFSNYGGLSLLSNTNKFYATSCSQV
jgi:hypothetical protein